MGSLMGSIIYSVFMFLQSFQTRETGFKVNKVPITNHPTVIICTHEDNGVHGRHIEDDHGIVEISYKAYANDRQ